MTGYSLWQRFRVAALASFVLLALGAGGGEAGDGGEVDARVELSDASSASESSDPEVARLRELAAHVRELIAGTLSVAQDPKALFDVDLADDDAVEVERRRLSAVLAPRPLELDASVEAAAVPAGKRPKPTPGTAPADAGADEAAADAAKEQAPVAEALWEARLDLDAARLQVLSLPGAARAKLLADHEARQKEAEKSAGADQKAQRRAEKAAEEREQALEDARLARSEAERQVAEERARLLGVKEAQAKYESELIAEEERTAKQADDTLGWHRKVAEMVRQRQSKEALPDVADRLYFELRANLRAGRAQLSAVMSTLASGKSEVPQPGADPLKTEGTGVDRSSVDSLRVEIEAAARKLERREMSSRWALAKALASRVDSMNRDRLSLYPHLSPELSSSLTSFSAEGWDQARAEGYQVALIARYHTQATASWVASWRDPERKRVADVFATLTILKMLGVVVLFVWWRRVADPVLNALKERVTPEPATTVVSRRSVTSIPTRAVQILARVRRPLEWLLLGWLLLTLAGPSVASLYEARIPWLILSWTMGGVVVVYVIDELFGHDASSPRKADTSALRLRSFLLVGRMVVAVGLSLALTRELVGRGTIHDWVLSSFWFIAIPVTLVLARWWRPTVFTRLGAQRKKNAFESWLLAHQEGWLSLGLVIIGGISLIAVRGFKAARAYVSGFGLARRALAYLFRREVSKQATSEKTTLSPIDPSRAAAFNPDLPTEVLLEAVGTTEIEAVTRSIDAVGGGVFALVGERGAGKTTVARRILAGRPDSLLVGCPPGGFEPFRRELLRTLGLGAEATDEDICKAIDARPEDNALLVDDAHRMVRPIIGGLEDFDRAVALARASSGTCTWVFCIGAGIWQYVARARGARPVFDQVFQLESWSEEQVGELLQRRTRDIGLDVGFDSLVAEPEDDPELFAEQLQRTEESYYRLLWDHASGNPAVAVYFWGESLRISDSGKVVVHLFEAPDTSDIERLPDDAVFVLRSVVQLELAAEQDIVAATRLPERQVKDALRYALFRGYVELLEGRYRIHWSWFRAITRFLERRHLLAKGN